MFIFKMLNLFFENILYEIYIDRKFFFSFEKKKINK